MKLKLKTALFLTGMISLAAVAQEFSLDTKTVEPPDKEKLSYALGMNLAMQLKQSGTQIDASLVAQAIKDVMDGSPTQLSPAEVGPLFAQQHAYEVGKQTTKNKAEGEAFLAKNATEKEVITLPDGLQYRVLTEGSGEIPKPTELVLVNFHGSWIDGTEFRARDHVQLPFKACPKGWQEALRLMKAGSKWRLFIPSNLAYGYQPGRAPGFGSTLIYDLELVSSESESAHPGEHKNTGRLGHSLAEDILPAAPKTSSQAAQSSQSGDSSGALPSFGGSK